MYRTSGANVKKKGAWYPCNGFFSFYSTGELYYPKMNDTKFSKEMLQKEDLLEALIALRLPNMKTREDFINELVRFGTPQFMYASSLLGGGIWQLPEMVTTLKSHFDMPFEISKKDHDIDVSGAIPISNERMLNEYAGYALSVNYFKNDQYIHPSYPWIDLRQWLHTPMLIGIDSPLNKRMARFTKSSVAAKSYDCFQTLYYEEPVTGKRFLMEIFLHMNLNTINCQEFVDIKKRAEKKLATFLLKEHQQAARK